VATRVAPTVFIQGSRVFGILSVFDGYSAEAAEEQTVACVSGGQDTIEQIDPHLNRRKDIIRRSDSHEVAGFIMREVGSRLFDDIVHGLSVFSHTQPSNGVAIQVELDQASGTPLSKIGIHAALNNAEKRSLRCPVDLSTLPRPQGGQFKRSEGLLPGGRVGGAVVKAHHDICAQRLLDFDHVFGGEEVFGAIDVGLKSNTLLSDADEFTETEYLIASAVRQDWTVPLHESMSEVEMIGVGEYDLGPELYQIFWCEGFNGCLGSHWHEGRGMDISVRAGYQSNPGVSAAILGADGKLQCH
jgi:hypothetical protein